MIVINFLSFSFHLLISFSFICFSLGMLTFPLPAPLKNNFMLVRAGECLADVQHEIQTNPVRKLRQDNALSYAGTYV